MSKTVYFLGVGIFVFLAYGFVISGAPYTNLDCTEEGYSYGRAASQMPLKDPSGLCDRKERSIHPAIFDLRVHLEQKLGLNDYTYDSIPEPEATIHLKNGTSITLACSNASEYVRSHPKQVEMAFWSNFRSVTMQPAEQCRRQMTAAMEYAEGIQNKS